MSRILVVEDEPDLAFGIRRNLEYEGHSVRVIHEGREALSRMLSGGQDLVVLDLMLPGIDGLSILRSVRGQGVSTPVLVLTARGEEWDKVRGLRGGADDYLTKPFGIAELLARVEALLRRSGGLVGEAREPESHHFGDVVVEVAARRVVRGGAPVDVAPRELDLLVALLRADGAALSRADLLRDVWGHKADVSTRTVDTHVGELRRKLEPIPSQPRFILTVRKFGYRLDVRGA